MREFISKRFKNMNRLYHYTSYKAACEIIKSKKFLFSKRYGLNDLIEGHKITTRMAFFEDVGFDMSKEYIPELEMMRYQQISFSQDKTAGDMVYEGFNLHSMWGLYADRGNGVCLVFDKDKLKLGARDYGRDVQYEDWIMPDYDFHNTSKDGVRSEVWQRKDELFFYKRKEWEREQEFRIIRRAKNPNDDEYLDVSDSLSFVILCKDDTSKYSNSIWSGKRYPHLKYISNRKLHVFWYKATMDGYALYHDYDDPVWTEEGGFETWD